MTVGKIALGVFLGNLAFALLLWIVIGTFAARQDAANSLREAEDQVRVLTNQSAP